MYVQRIFAIFEVIDFDRLQDIYSYSTEQATGQSGNNIVTVLMKENNLTLQQAADHIGVHSQQLMDDFVSAKARLPSWGLTVDGEVTRYIHGLSTWVRGNLE